jgi:hypothetical protein
MNLDFNKVYQFKISLKEIRPEIWRRIQVPQNYTFWDLHVAIQDVMGWLDYHLHVFRIPEPSSNEMHEIGIPEYELDSLPGWELAISDYFSKGNNSVEYEYDFGDSWQHEIVLEQILPRDSGSKYPKCIAGERACPPEDCGGVWGYQEFLEAIMDLNHEEHERMLEWVGGPFDPQSFDPKQVTFDDPDERWQRRFTKKGDSP